MTDETDQQHGAHDAWDEFWAEVEAEEGPARTEVIRGVTVTVPRDLPLRVTRKIELLQNSSREEDVASLLKDLFGADVLDAWVTAGMGATELQTALAWGIAQAGGKDISFREAYEIVKRRTAEAETAAEGKASGPRPSNSTGRRSKRTSAASTG
ncbi:hypothetical protein ACFY19_20705 [Streptosporangium saharense]|uniref:hypothetical protein n=1 Tax=Streptosporangium saharense TaxID=1706840 RepID=UPI0036A374FB